MAGCWPRCWRLVYLQADPALLRARLRDRVERFDANAAFPITDELLARYLDSFEPPSSESEELIVVSDPDGTAVFCDFADGRIRRVRSLIDRSTVERQLRQA